MRRYKTSPRYNGKFSVVYWAGPNTRADITWAMIYFSRVMKREPMVLPFYPSWGRKYSKISMRGVI